MGFGTLVALAFVAVVVVSIRAAVAENKKVAAMSPSEKKTYLSRKEASTEVYCGNCRSQYGF